MFTVLLFIALEHCSSLNLFSSQEVAVLSLDTGDRDYFHAIPGYGHVEHSYNRLMGTTW